MISEVGEVSGIEGTLELSTVAGPSLSMGKDSFVFKFGDKVLATINKDSSEQEIFKGLREFISVFDGNLQKMIDDKLVEGSHR